VDRLPLDALGEPYEHAGTLAEGPDDALAHGEVVLDDVELRLPDVGKVGTVRVRDTHHPVIDLDLGERRGHASTLSRVGHGMSYPVEKSDAEWRQQLTPEEYAVLRKGGTERPFVGEYTDITTEGVYRCRACSAELFRSDTKFASHCGWPSFYDPTSSDAVELLEDRSFGSVRTEVRCRTCGSHLGHVFAGEGYPTPTDQRYCINSISVTLEPGPTA
jgi:peptide-methionine (R)-S-oxide reductase